MSASGEKVDTAQYILHHVADGYDMEVPGPSGMAHVIDLREVFGDWTVKLGGYSLDLTPTKSTLMLWIATVFVIGGLLWSMRNRQGVPRGRLQNFVEMLFLFVRDEIAVKSIGEHAARYTPYLATCFFFILSVNLLGLIPYGATATGSISVTFVLAICTFIVTQMAGMYGQGSVRYWFNLVPAGVPAWLYPLLFVIEFIGLFTKPFALMVRLFANMVAGHVILFFLIGIIFLFQSIYVAPVAIGLSFMIFFLELFVAMVQAYIFTLLSAVFIGLSSHAH